MFGFKKKLTKIKAFATGKVIPLENVVDQVFSSKMMGDGFAIQPTNGSVISPFDAKITSIFPTKHAIMLSTKEGLNVLLHLGIDTVELKGKPFEMYISENDTVKAGQKLLDIDLNEIHNAGKQTDLIFILTNGDEVSTWEVNYDLVQLGDDIGTINYK